jgi:hypothetical protein
MASHLAEARRLKVEEERRVEERRRQAAEELRHRKREENRWRRFVEFARASEEARLARSFLAELRKQPATDSMVATDPSANGWRGARVRGLELGAAALFGEIAQVTDWAPGD